MDSKSGTDVRVQKILDAAKIVFAQYGYVSATIKRIASEAGVSRGLLHYYFESKDEIFAKILNEHTKVGTEMFADIFNLHNTAEGYAEAITRALRDVIENDPFLFLFFFEGVVLVRHSAVLRRELSDSYTKWRQVFEVGLECAQEKHAISPSLPAKALAAFISALLEGMGLQFLLDPNLVENDFIWENFEECLTGLLKGKH